MDKFLASYIETALWSSTHDGEPLDGLDAELANETYRKMAVDCAEFETAIEPLISALDGSVQRSIPQSNCGGDRIAHDFWLTRNHHGAGFWDGDYPEPIATQLTDLAHSFGECDLYVGDDGKIYC